MHLHAWNSPPLTPLTDDDWRHKPYLIEYPTDQIRAKVDHMTKLLEDAFQTKMLSHRAGRWAFNEYYASLLLEYGYQVDCSVTPRVNWQFRRAIRRATAAPITPGSRRRLISSIRRTLPNRALRRCWKCR